MQKYKYLTGLVVALIVFVGVSNFNTIRNLETKIDSMSGELVLLQAQVYTAPVQKTNQDSNLDAVNADNLWQKLAVTDVLPYEQYALNEISQYMFKNDIINKYAGKTITITRKSTNGKLVASSDISVSEGIKNGGAFEVGRCTVRTTMTISPISSNGSFTISGSAKHKGFLFWDTLWSGSAEFQLGW